MNVVFFLFFHFCFFSLFFSRKTNFFFPNIKWDIQHQTHTMHHDWSVSVYFAGTHDAYETCINIKKYPRLSAICTSRTQQKMPTKSLDLCKNVISLISRAGVWLFCVCVLRLLHINKNRYSIDFSLIGLWQSFRVKCRKKAEKKFAIDVLCINLENAFAFAA